MPAPYTELTQRLSDLAAIEGALGILQWDQEIVMPSGAAEARGRQIAVLSVLAHEKLTSPELGALLESLQGSKDLDETQTANVREALRDHRRAVRIPAELVRAWGEATVAGHEVWVQTRKDNDFKAFQPILTKLVDLARRRAEAVNPHAPAYDVLIDEFEPGMTMARLDPVFDELKAFLVPFIAQVRAAGKPVDTAWRTSHVSTEDQRKAGEAIVRSMGYDFTRGRLDTSVHPFCGGAGPDDVRITTRYKENGFTGSLLGMIHETGHALYEQGRDASVGDQPVSRARSMGIHESQSLLWEKQVGQGRSFWTWHFPKLQEAYPFLAGISLDDFLFGINEVDFTNLIRVDADELTYPLHVILRYEIERDLFSGALPVANLPEAWNAKMRAYLDIVPPQDRNGVLQDVHWSGGLFGYFPSYTLGALYAAQFYQTAVREVPGVPDALAGGQPGPLLDWLRGKIHRPGSRWLTDDLCTRATGRSLDPQAFIGYARQKYSRLYRLA
ncbi:MAG: carboxypeptidase M32 [Myxococcota bacterium]